MQCAAWQLEEKQGSAGAMIRVEESYACSAYQGFLFVLVAPDELWLDTQLLNY